MHGLRRQWGFASQSNYLRKTQERRRAILKLVRSSVVYPPSLFQLCVLFAWPPFHPNSLCVPAYFSILPLFIHTAALTDSLGLYSVLPSLCQSLFHSEKNLFSLLSLLSLPVFCFVLFSGSWSLHFWFLFFIFLLPYITICSEKVWQFIFPLHVFSCQGLYLLASQFFLFPHLPPNDRAQVILYCLSWSHYPKVTVRQDHTTFYFSLMTLVTLDHPVFLSSWHELLVHSLLAYLISQACFKLMQK